MDLSFISNVVSNAGQVDFLASLKDRFDHWNRPGKINEFYNNLPHDNRDDFATEPFKDGFIVVTSNAIFYDDVVTGECHRLEKTWNDDDHELFVKLANYTKFRTEKVVERNKVSIHGTEWMYTKYASPNGEYGDSLMSVRRDPQDLGRLFIDESAELIKAVAEIGNGKAPSLMLNMGNWYKDSVGWFWANLQDWSSTLEAEKAAGLVYGKMTLDISVSLNQLTKEQAADVLEYAKSKWV